MLPKIPRDMTEAILREGLGAWSESQTLEFKQILPRFDVDPNARQEFLKDVCALANADGGDIVYGVREENSVARELLPIVGQDPDPLRRRLLQTLDAGLEPRISGVVMEPVAIQAGGFAWVTRVPASYDAPHRYRYSDSYRFVVRNGTLTSEMSYDQLRTAFDRSAALVERAEAFRRTRVDGVMSGLAWRTLAHGPLVVVHVLPVAAFSRRATIDVGSLHDGNYMAFAQNGWGAVTIRTLSIDGRLNSLRTLAFVKMSSWFFSSRSGADFSLLTALSTFTW